MPEILKKWYFHHLNSMKMRGKRGIALLICLFFSLPAIIRASVADSLEAVAEALPDSARTEKYLEWSHSLSPQVRINIGRKGIAWAISNNKTDLVGRLLHNIGTAYFITGEHPLALDCYQKAIRVFELTGNRVEIGKEHTVIGQLLKKRYPDAAEKEYRKALDIFREERDTANLAAIYNYLGNFYEDVKQDQDIALQCYNQSLSYAQPYGDSASVAYSLDFIAGIYLKQGRYEESLRLLNEELRLQRWTGDKLGQAINLNNMGEVYKTQGKADLAESYFLQALEMAEELNYKDFMMHIYTMLSEISRDRRDFANAYRYMELKSAVKDSLISEKKNYQIAEIKEKYESENREQRILTLQKETELGRQREINLRNYFISAMLVLVLGGIIGWLYYNQQQQRKLSGERIAQEQLRTRAIIEAEEKERIRIARELHDGVGQLLAAAKMNLSPGHGIEEKKMENASKLVDDAIREVRTVSHSMMPDVLMKHGLANAIKDLADKIGSGTSLEVSLQISGWEERWEASSESVLYRVVQELLGNVLKHSQARKVSIDLNKFDDEISLIVEDDGKGFDPSNPGAGAGIGLKNMQSRIAFLGGHMVIDSVPGRGTTTIISVPLKKTAYDTGSTNR